jgi:hypothetical protein
MIFKKSLQNLTLDENAYKLDAENYKLEIELLKIQKEICETSVKGYHGKRKQN